MNGDKTIISITSGTIIRAILLVLGVAILFYLRDLLLVIITAIVLASSLEPAVHWFAKFQIPRIPAVLISYVLMASFFVVFVYFFVPPLLDEAITFIGNLPDQLTTLGLANSPGALLTSDFVDFSSLFSLQNFFSEFQSVISGSSGGLISAASVLFGGALSFALIFVLSFSQTYHNNC